MGLFLPPTVTKELLEERRAFEQDIRARTVRQEMLRVKSVLDEFNYELKRIDPKLEMVRAGEDTFGTPLKPGYYCVIRWNEGAPPSVMNVESENGEFVEPTARVFEVLAREDLWDPNNMRVLKQRQRLAEQAAEERKLKERAERQDELWERWTAASRTQVSMNRAAPWAQNAAGFKRTRGQRREPR